MAVKKYGLNGLSTNVELGKNGLRLKSDGTTLSAKNNDDNALVRIKALTATENDDVVVKAQMDTALGAKQNTLSVAAGSESYLDITNDAISISALAITDVTVDTNAAHTTIELFVADAYTEGTEYQNGDVVILTEASDTTKRSYIHNGGGAGTAADFTRLQTDLNETAIKAMFSAGSGLSYLDGVFSLDQINGTDVVTTNTGYTTITGLTAQALFDDIESVLSTNATDISNLETLVGSPNSQDLGTFTGDTITDNSTVKVALQELETAVEGVESAIHMGCRKVEFNYLSTSPLDIESAIPSGAYVKEISVKVTTPFDDIAATLEVGKSGDTDLFMTSAQNDLQDAGNYAETLFEVMAADTQAIATISPGSSGQGAGYILIEYC